MNPLCSCSLEIIDSSHYLLQCHHFCQHRIDLIKSAKSILENFESLSDNIKKEVILYGRSRLDGNKNKFILEAKLIYINSIDSNRFSGIQDLLLIKDSSLLKITHP